MKRKATESRLLRKKTYRLHSPSFLLSTIVKICRLNSGIKPTGKQMTFPTRKGEENQEAMAE